nr:unnamed protein product [Digitaria exilis]
MLCLPCHDKLKGIGKCHVCGVAMAGGYRRCHGMERLVDSLRAACPNAPYGCAETPPYHGRDEHIRTCPHAPCHCPGGEACWLRRRLHGSAPGALPRGARMAVRRRRGQELRRNLYGAFIQVYPLTCFLRRADRRPSAAAFCPHRASQCAEACPSEHRSAPPVAPHRPPAALPCPSPLRRAPADGLNSTPCGGEADGESRLQMDRSRGSHPPGPVGREAFVVDDKDMDSDEALMALYERWCKVVFGEERSREEMQRRFTQVKHSVLLVDRYNKKADRDGNSSRLEVNMFADGKLAEKRRVMRLPMEFLVS